MGDGRSASMLVVGHAATRTGAPAVTLSWLRWLQEQGVHTEAVVLAGGALETDFEAAGARVIGPMGSHAWMIERGLSKLGMKRSAALAALVRHGPVLRRTTAPTVYLGSVTAGFALRFLPADRQVVTHVHELDFVVDAFVSAEMWLRLVERTSVWVAPADCVSEMLERRGVAPDRIVIQPEFVDRRSLRQGDVTGETIRRRLGVPEDTVLIGAAGTTDWRKGADLFIRLAASLDRGPDIAGAHFVWIGGSSRPDDLRHFWHDVAMLGLEDRFHFIGEVDDAPAWIASLDVLCVTSREDPMPLVAIEASMHSTPIVAFDCGGLSEVARGHDGERMLVVDHLDIDAMDGSVRSLLRDKERAVGMAEAANTWATANCDVVHAAPRLYAKLRERVPALQAV